MQGGTGPDSNHSVFQALLAWVAVKEFTIIWIDSVRKGLPYDENLRQMFVDRSPMLGMRDGL